MSSGNPTTTGCKSAQVFDHGIHLTPAQLGAIGGPFVHRPLEKAPAYEWLRWAREIKSHYELAESILDSAGHKKVADDRERAKRPNRRGEPSSNTKVTQ